MDWTDVAGLALGLGVGTLGGWLTRRVAGLGDRSVLGGRRSDYSTVQMQGDSPRDSQQEDWEVESIAPAPVPSSRLPAPALALTEQLERTQLAYRMATEMGQFKAGFLARTAHELRSPLNRVISLHQLILNGLCDSPEEEQEFIVQSYAAAEQMLALLDQVISVSKAAHGTLPLALQPVDLKEVLTNIEYLTQLQAKNRNLRLMIEVPDESIYAVAEPRWLEQVVLSLVDTPLSLMEQGQVRVAIETTASQVQIWIEDERPVHFWREPIDLLSQLKLGRSLHSQPSDSDSAQISDHQISDHQMSDCQMSDCQMSDHQMLDSHQSADQMDEAESTLSPGLSLLTNQTLVEVMGGRLEVLAVPAIAESSSKLPDTGLTRIRLSLAKAEL